MDYIAYYDGDTLIGMTVAILMKNYNYGANMAVVENFRGKGYGRQDNKDRGLGRACASGRTVGRYRRYCRNISQAPDHRSWRSGKNRIQKKLSPGA